MQMINLAAVQKSLNEHKSQISSYGVSRIGVYGSIVRGEMKESSDIDMIVEFSLGKKNYDNYIDLVFMLESLFKRKIDMVTSDSLTEPFKKYIRDEVEYFEV
jgi:uncharacterized protein